MISFNSINMKTIGPLNVCISLDFILPLESLIKDALWELFLSFEIRLSQYKIQAIA